MLTRNIKFSFYNNPSIPCSIFLNPSFLKLIVLLYSVLMLPENDVILTDIDSGILKEVLNFH